MTSDESSIGIAILLGVAVMALYARNKFRRIEHEQDTLEEFSCMSDEIDTDEFARDLAAAVAKQLTKVARARGTVTVTDMYKIQEASSLFSPYTFDRIMQELRKEGVTPVNKPFGL